MSGIRLTSVVASAASVAGIVTLAVGGSRIEVAFGAVLLAGGALTLVRAFWREGEKRAQRVSSSLERSFRSDIARLDSKLQEYADRTVSQKQSIEDRLNVFTRGVLEYTAQLEVDLEGLEVDLEGVADRLDRVTDRLDRVAARLDDVKRQNEQAASKDDLATVERHLKSADRNAMRYRDSVLSQVSGVIGVYSILEPALPYPPFGGWAISGDCAQRLIGSILTHRPEWIIEIGSGLSTLLAAQALDLVADNGRVISLEHEDRWLEETNILLESHGVRHRAQVLHAPLVDVAVSNDETFLWYDLANISLPERAQLIFIDGPPQATGPLARYPALPLLYDRLEKGGIILMDDASRPDEKAIVDRWTQEYSGLSVRFHPDAKGTVEIVKDAS